MNILEVGRNYIAFAGKTTVYVKALPKEPIKGSPDDLSSNGNPGELPHITFPSEWIAKNGHIECLAINHDDKLVAVGDSMHGLHLFKLESAGGSPNWLQIFSGNSNKRLIKLRFTDDGQFLTFLDKQGDIFAAPIQEDGSKIKNIKKIMGHTSFISDYAIRAETKQIVSCDRDEKLRVSNFPDAFVIQGFKLGHTESVINVAILKLQNKNDNGESSNCTYLLSISLAGILLLWDFDKPVDGTSTDFLKRWNIKELLPEEEKETGVKLMKAVCTQGNIYLSVTLTGSSKIYVFEVSLPSYEIAIHHEMETESENVLMEWVPSTGRTCSLIIYTPDLGSIKCWHKGDVTLGRDLISNSKLHESIISDMKASTESLKPPVVPMKKRLTTFEDTTALLQDQKSKKAKS